MARSAAPVYCLVTFVVLTQSVLCAATNHVRHVWRSAHGHVSMTGEIVACLALHRVAVFRATNAALDSYLAPTSVLVSVVKSAPKVTVSLVQTDRTPAWIFSR